MKEFRDLQMKYIDTTEMEEKRQALHLDCMRCMHAMEYESGTAGIMVRVCVCVCVGRCCFCIYAWWVLHRDVHVHHDFTENTMSVLKGYGSQRLLVCHVFVPSMQV